jgi:hypothetical protein
MSRFTVALVGGAALVAATFVFAARAPCAHAEGKTRGLGTFSLGLGVGPSFINEDVSGNTVELGSRLSAGIWLTQSWQLVLAYDRRGFSDDEPTEDDIMLDPDGGPTIVVRRPEINRVDFLTVGIQLDLLRGIYVRPEFGIGRNFFADYEADADSGNILDALVSAESGRALGLAVGYWLAFNPSWSMTFETFLRSSSGSESSSPRGTYGLDLAVQYTFSL